VTMHIDRMVMLLTADKCSFGLSDEREKPRRGGAAKSFGATATLTATRSAVIEVQSTAGSLGHKR
jgi:hypothetical protein